MPELATQFRSPIGRATIGDQLRRHARTQPDKVAFISYTADDTRTTVTYGQLDSRVNQFANLLIELGVRHGDRVASMARNSVDVVSAYYATLKVGAAFTGINVMYREAEVQHQLTHAEPTVVIADSSFTATVSAVIPASMTLLTYGTELDERLSMCSDIEPDVAMNENDVAMVVYTSGTEAAPKGVMIPHRNFLISTAPAWSWGLRTGPEDTWLFVMPFHTIAGLGSMTTLTLMGATLVLPATVDPEQSLRIIAEEKITVIAQTPTFYMALERHSSFTQTDVRRVKRCLTYGGQVSPHTIDAWAAAAPDAIWGTYWGQSELSQLGSVGWFSTLADIPDGDASWIGKPVTHLEIRVVDADGNDTEIGELLCRTPSVMLGYFRDEDKTAEVFRGGWVHTGDVVRVDKAGNMFFYDRMKDMIKSGGMNVSSQEVERALHAHPDVLRAAVVGVQDPYWSEAVTAFVIAVEDSNPDPAALIEYCRVSLASYKIPKAVHIVAELPVDPQGKILKRVLRTMAESVPT